jgi:uncharacterized protein (DUF2236 family)
MGGTDGYFPEGRSMLREVQGERIVGQLYGIRAAVIGATDVVTYAGTSLSTNAEHTPFRRLMRTAKAFNTVFFGSREEADRTLAIVARLHDGVNGTLPQRLGKYDAGTPYSAWDPDLMLWTLVVLADSSRAAYETLVRRLTGDEREALWQDWRFFGELFGLPGHHMPATHEEFRDYFEAHLASDDRAVIPEARFVAGRVVFDIPTPMWGKPGIKLIGFLSLGLLPQRVRDLHGLSWTRADEAAFRALAAWMRTTRPVVPRSFRRGTNDRLLDVVNQTERRQIRDNTATPIPESLRLRA